MSALPPVDLVAARALWERYLASEPPAPIDPALPSVERFGDHPALVEELLGLALSGTKTATSTLVAEFEVDGQPLPGIGSHWIACDATGAPRCILRSIELRLGPIDSVDDAFAFDEGEDDRSRASWLVEHERYWRRQCERIGVAWSRDLPVLFERFVVAFTA